MTAPRVPLRFVVYAVAIFAILCDLAGPGMDLAQFAILMSYCAILFLIYIVTPTFLICNRPHVPHGSKVVAAASYLAFTAVGAAITLAEAHDLMVGTDAARRFYVRKEYLYPYAYRHNLLMQTLLAGFLLASTIRGRGRPGFRDSIRVKALLAALLACALIRFSGEAEPPWRAQNIGYRVRIPPRAAAAPSGS